MRVLNAGGVGPAPIIGPSTAATAANNHLSALLGQPSQQQMLGLIQQQTVGFLKRDSSGISIKY
jgi:hypothetical protein